MSIIVRQIANYWHMLQNSRNCLLLRWLQHHIAEIDMNNKTMQHKRFEIWMRTRKRRLPLKEWKRISSICQGKWRVRVTYGKLTYKFLVYICLIHEKLPPFVTMLQKDLFQANLQSFRLKQKEGLARHCDLQQLCRKQK